MNSALHRQSGRVSNRGAGALSSAACPPAAALSSLSRSGPIGRWWSDLLPKARRNGSSPHRPRPPASRQTPKPPERDLRRQLQELIGPLLTMGVILGLAGVMWHRINVIYLPLMLVLAVAFAGYLGGTRQGLVSAGLAWVFLAFYLFAARHDQKDWLTSWLIWTLVLPSVTLLTGYLQERVQEKEFKPWKGDLAPFRMASESVLDLAVVLLDRQGCVTTWNTAAQRLFGWSAADMASKSLARCLAPELVVAGTLDTGLNAAAAQGRHADEWSFVRKDASRFRAKVTIVALHDDQGQMAGYTFSAQDLSDRQEAASFLLRRAHQQVAVAALSQAALTGTDMRVLLEHAVTFIVQTWAVDLCQILELQPDGQSLRMEAGAGWKENCVGQVTVEANPKSMIGYALKAAEPVIVKDLTQVTQFNVPDYLRANGVMSSLLVAIPGRPQPLGILGVHLCRPGDFSQDDLGFLQSVAGVLATAHARKRAEAETAKLAAFPQYNPNPVFEFGEDGSLTYFNDAAAAMASTLKLGNASDMLPQETPAIVRQCLASGLNRSGLETRFDGRIFIWSYYPIPDVQRVHLYAVDATDRLSLEAQLRQSQKMEAIGQLAAGVAHDINNILTVMQGYACRLLERDNPPAPSEDAQQILDAADRAASLTRQLLAFSRRQNMQLRLLDLRVTVSGMVRMLERLIGENIRLTVTNPESLPGVAADSGLVEQVLLNLVVNARDAMPEGGEIVVETAEVVVSEAEAQKRPQARAGQYVLLKVSDTGCGMDSATLARIFEPFFTTKGPGKGTGLGLATVYGIVQQHEGWLEVESVPGHGTAFSVLLPAADGQVEQPRHDTEIIRPLRGGSETVLVVEDEALLRSLACATLAEFGYTVLEASNALEAIVVWQRQGRNVDLLLTDMVMPGGLTGQELGERLRQDKPALKVVFCSGYTADIPGVDFGPATGISFLQKPYRPRVLARVVRDCLDGKCGGEDPA
jgi:PAS domain S-box-containing protein